MDPQIAEIPHKSQIIFWHSLTNIRIGALKEENDPQQKMFTTQILMPIHNTMNWIENTQNFEKLSCDPKVILNVDRLFSALTGITKGRFYFLKIFLFFILFKF